MGHKGFQDQIFLLHDGELPADQQAEVRAHLAECAECGAMNQQWTRVSQQLSVSNTEIQSNVFVSNVMKRLPPAEAAPSFWRLPSLGFGLSFAALVLLVTFEIQPEAVSIDSMLLGSTDAMIMRTDELLGITVED